MAERLWPHLPHGKNTRALTVPSHYGTAGNDAAERVDHREELSPVLATRKFKTRDRRTVGAVKDSGFGGGVELGLEGDDGVQYCLRFLRGSVWKEVDAWLVVAGAEVFVSWSGVSCGSQELDGGWVGAIP